MSLDRKSVHVRLTPEMHDRLAVLAGLSNNDLAEHAAYLLEKMIVADYHAITVQAYRMARLGLTGRDRDRAGSGQTEEKTCGS